MENETVNAKPDEAPAAAPLEPPDPAPVPVPEPDPQAEPEKEPAPGSGEIECAHCGATTKPGGRVSLPDEKMAALQDEVSELRAQVKILAVAKRKELADKAKPKPNGDKAPAAAPPAGAIGPAPGQGLMNWIVFGRRET